MSTLSPSSPRMRAHALYRKYFPIYLVIKWLLIVAGLALTPQLLRLF